MSSSKKLDTGLTCISCRLVFANFDLQREHYRTDWHRYNVKRQVAQLPPIPLVDFQAKEDIFGDGKEPLPVENPYCKACRKAFQSINSYENHVNSRKHQENALLLSIMEEEMEKAKAEGKEWPKPKAQKKSPVVEDIPSEDKNAEVSDEDDGESSSSGSWHTINSEDDDEDESDEIVSGEDLSQCSFLVLPSGATIGHRSLFRYFRQSLKPVDPLSAQNNSARKFKLSGKHLQKALGWTGTTGQLSIQKAKDMKFLKKVASKYQLKNGVNTNRLFVTRGRKDQQ